MRRSKKLHEVVAVLREVERTLGTLLLNKYNLNKADLKSIRDLLREAEVATGKAQIVLKDGMPLETEPKAEGILTDIVRILKKHGPLTKDKLRAHLMENDYPIPMGSLHIYCDSLMRSGQIKRTLYKYAVTTWKAE
jgi:ribosomal protein L24